MKKATKINLTLLALALSANGLYAQQGFGTNQPSKAAVIDMQSESKGLLIPRVSLTSLTVFSPVRGETATNVGKTNSLLVYNTATVGATIKPGYYYWTTDGTTPNSSWKRLLANDDASALALIGDVTGTLGATVVGKIQGTPVANTAPTSNQVLTYNGTAWTPTTITPATISGKGTLTTQGGIEFTGSTSGTDKLLGDATIQIANGGVTAQKLTAGTGTAGRVAVADANGVVTYTNAVPSSSVSGQNVTAGSTKVTLGGTPAGAALKAFSIDVSEANLSLNNIGGTLNANKITPGANGQVLTTNSTGNTVWADKASLITSVSNISNINTLTTTVNGVTGAGVNIVNSNLLSLNGTNQLVSTVNGVASTGLNLGPAVTAATTHTLGVSGNTLTSTVNGVAPTASILNNFSNALSGTTLSTNANGLAASIDLAPAIKAGETLTSLSQNTTSGVITYTPERGSTSTANVLSATTGNLITYDSGAFLNAAVVKNNQQNTIVQGTGAISVPTAVTTGNNTTYTVGVNTATSTALGVVRPGSGLSINSGVLSVDATTTGIGKTLTGSGITVNGGASLSNTVLTDVTLGIADNAITSTKIANNAVTVGKLPAGASATTFLRGDGTWVTPTDNNTTYTGSTSVTLNGTSFERAALTGDVTAPANSNVTTIADGVVNSAKIENGSIEGEDLNATVAGNGLTQAANGALQVNANNGLTVDVTADAVQLGGSLNKPTTITTTATNTLALAGLQSGAVADKIVVADTDGVLKVVDQSTVAIEPWNVQGGTTKATTNSQNIYQTGSVAIGKNAVTTHTASGTSSKFDVNGAVRIGTSSGQIGVNSLTVGSSSNASGDNSLSVGLGNTVSGFAAFSAGSGNSSKGVFSSTLGNNNETAEVSYAAALGGTGNKANAISSVTIGGTSNTAAGDNSFATGISNISQNVSEAVLGRYNAVRTGGNGTTWGTTLAEQNARTLFQIGNGTISGSTITGNNALTLTQSGRLGIGITGADNAALPTQTLDVGSGNVRVRDINTSSGLSTDKVVVSDTNGVLKTVDSSSLVLANQRTTTVVAGTNVSVSPTTPSATGNTAYTVNVPTATSSALGAVRPGAGLSINSGVLSVDASAAGIGKTLTGSGITVNGGTSLANTVLADVTLGIADNAITSTKIANNAVTVGKLPAGASATTFLRGDGTWVTPTDNNTTYTGSTSVTLNGTSFERAALTGDVTAPANSNVTTIADNAVNSAKIANGSIQGEDLNANIAGNGLTQAASGALQVNANNGLTVDATADAVQLGGNLTKATTITQSTYPLTIATGGTALTVSGLPTGAVTDRSVVADANNVLKTVKQAPRFFYMPAVIFDTSVNGNNLQRDLYQDYANQFSVTTTYNIAHGQAGYSMPYTGGIISSDSAKPTIPIYTSGELIYYITYYDTNVFAGPTGGTSKPVITSDGKLQYSIKSNAVGTSYMNIVFVVKE